MNNLTYKDLKALYESKVYFERKAIANVFYLTLCEALPVLSDDIDWFLEFLQTQSKKSLDKTDEKGLLRGDAFQWNNKYLTLDEHYQTLNRKLRFLLRQHIMQSEDDKPAEITTMAEWLAFVREITQELHDWLDSGTREDYLEGIEWITASTDRKTLRLRHYIEISFASTFNHISLVQNKATISKLLYNALNENQIENFKKIFAVDTSVFDLKEVQDFINKQPREVKAKIHKYYSDSIDLPIISNNKNKVSQKPMFIIGLLDSMNVINGQISFSKTRLLKLGTLAGIDHDTIDQTYFNRLLLHVKK